MEVNMIQKYVIIHDEKKKKKAKKKSKLNLKNGLRKK
jgi:hypothetical protein